MTGTGQWGRAREAMAGVRGTPVIQELPGTEEVGSGVLSLERCWECAWGCPGPPEDRGEDAGSFRLTAREQETRSDSY